jgi:glycosyltransferase involved in cell wall biosynthesis
LETNSAQPLAAPVSAGSSAANGATFSIVCLSSQDWRAPLPTNRHQIMLRAARLGHDVLFVETGYFLGRHLWRLVRGRERRSLARRLLSTEQVAPGISVRKAVNLLPWGQKFRLPNTVNAAVTASLLRRSARRLTQPVVAWIYDPTSSEMAGSLGEAFAVYDCVDDYPAQAGSDRRRRALVAAGDEQAAGAARIVFTTTRTLFERQRRINPDTHLVPNVGDYEHFSPAADRAHSAPDVAALPRPVLGFAGNLVPSKVDFALLEAVARARPEWTVLLVGPGQRESEKSLRRVSSLPNVHWLGAKPYAELPHYVAAFDVGLIPYVANTYTESCLPLKLYEYLAAGKPVVASGLPELAGMEPDVLLADGEDAFVAGVDRALGRLGESERAARMALAAGNTWETRTDRLLGLVRGALGG